MLRGVQEDNEELLTKGKGLGSDHHKKYNFCVDIIFASECANILCDL
jgi:hypothetical protein